MINDLPSSKDSQGDRRKVTKRKIDPQLPEIAIDVEEKAPRVINIASSSAYSENQAVLMPAPKVEELQKEDFPRLCK